MRISTGRGFTVYLEVLSLVLTAVKLWLLLTGLDVCGLMDSDMVEMVVGFTLPEGSSVHCREGTRAEGSIPVIQDTRFSVFFCLLSYIFLKFFDFSLSHLNSLDRTITI